MVQNDPLPPPGIDISRPTVARMYDYYMNGTHNYPADRDAVDAVLRALPDIREIVVENRAFLRRTVRYMCRQGVEQFIDIGSGLPSADNTHQVAQRMVPGARVVYCDIDETAVVHGRQILGDNPTVAFIQGSALELSAVLTNPETKELIDFSRPFGVLMMGLLHFFPVEKGRELIEFLNATLPPGSYVAFSHGTTDEISPDAARRTEEAYAKTPTPLFLRPRAEIERIIQGLKVVEPGLVKTHMWRIDELEAGEKMPPKTLIWYGAVVETA